VIGDPLRWTVLNRQKLGAMTTAMGSSPAVAGRALMVMDLPPVEARALVTETVLAAARDPAIAGALSSLCPLVDRWRRRPDIVALLGDDAEAVGMLWASVVALGWSLGPPDRTL
jgi:hypothetical protein